MNKFWTISGRIFNQLVGGIVLSIVELFKNKKDRKMLDDLQNVERFFFCGEVL